MTTRTLTADEMTRLETGRGVEDLELTCEGDTGHGPCGTYTDWTRGRCACGHVIEIAEEE